MKSEQKSRKKIPMKNYVIVFAILIAAILITMYAFQLYNLSQKNKFSKSNLVTSNTILYEIKSIEELPDALNESPSEYFLYISYTGDKNIYKLEDELKPIIKKYGLKEEFYYLNITDIKDEKDYLEKINSKLNLNYNITSVPTILYIKDGKLVKNGVVSREDNNIIEVGDFQKMLDILEIQPENK